MGKIKAKIKVKVKVAMYIRYSSNNQRDESLDAQRRAINEYCNKNNYECVKEYSDAAKSARSDDREGFMQMISDIKNGPEYSKVIVHKLDRFSRNNYDTMLYRALLHNNGIELLSVTELMENTPEGVMFTDIISTMNQFYSANLRREVMKGLKENAYKCLHTGGKPPYGFDIVNKKLTINATEAEAVRLLFKLFDAGFTYSAIAEHLYKKGYSAPGKSDRFKKATINSILKNEKYIGVYTYNKSNGKNIKGKRTKFMKKSEEDIIRIPGGCPAVVSLELFARVQAKMKLGSRNIHKSNNYYPLADNDLIVCSDCGNKLTGNMKYSGRNKTEYKTYNCYYHKKHECATKDIQTVYLEDFVFTNLKKIYFSKKMRPYLLKKLNESTGKLTNEEKNELRKYKDELADVNMQITNIVNVMAKSGLKVKDLSVKLAELNESKITLKSKINDLNDIKAKKEYTDEDIIKLGEEFVSYLKTNDTLVTRRFLKSIIEQISVGEEDIEVTLNIA